MNEQPNPTKSQLDELQHAFAAYVFDDEKNTSESCALKKVDADKFSSAQRFRIYHNNIFIGFREALTAIYPVINKLVGDEFFNNVAREYLRAYPSNSGNVHVFGNVFPDFLAEFPGTESLPYLSDVAQLEWAYHRVFHSPKSPVLNVQKLSSLDEESASRLRFDVAENCCVLSSEYPILEIWQANQEGVENRVVDLDEGGIQVVVRYSGADVEFRPLNKAIFTLLKSLSKGGLFVDACAEVASVAPDCDVGVMLNELFGLRLLTGFSCE